MKDDSGRVVLLKLGAYPGNLRNLHYIGPSQGEGAFEALADVAVRLQDIFVFLCDRHDKEGIPIVASYQEHVKDTLECLLKCPELRQLEVSDELSDEIHLEAIAYLCRWQRMKKKYCPYMKVLGVEYLV